MKTRSEQDSNTGVYKQQGDLTDYLTLLLNKFDGNKRSVDFKHKFKNPEFIF